MVANWGADGWVTENALGNRRHRPENPVADVGRAAGPRELYGWRLSGGDADGLHLHVEAHDLAPVTSGGSGNASWRLALL